SVRQTGLRCRVRPQPPTGFSELAGGIGIRRLDLRQVIRRFESTLVLLFRRRLVICILVVAARVAVTIAFGPVTLVFLGCLLLGLLLAALVLVGRAAASAATATVVARRSRSRGRTLVGDTGVVLRLLDLGQLAALGELLD